MATRTTSERPGLEIRADDLSSPAIHALLREHLADMHASSPPQSVHALDLEGLRGADITFWSAWAGDALLGCGALKALDATHGEIKSMRTTPSARGQGVARRMLEHIVAEAERRGYRRLSLETGTPAAFEAARRLYASAGFVECGPFAQYTLDPYSVFMTRVLPQR